MQGLSAACSPAQSALLCPRRCTRRATSTAVASSRRVPKNPASWSGDYDAIRKSLEAGEDSSRSIHALPSAGPTLGRTLNWIGTTFGGQFQERLERLGDGASLGEKLGAAVWRQLTRLVAREEPESRLDPALLANAAARVSDSDKAAAVAVWGSRADGQTAVLLACGCVPRSHLASVSTSDARAVQRRR